MRDKIREEVVLIEPIDDLERETISNILIWIDSGAELCRIDKPATPDKHLVSYFVVLDGEYILLVDHINAEKWLPTGGHVEPGEHPRETATRECLEELYFECEFLLKTPILITSTETVGKTSGHTDISIWYAIKGNKSLQVEFDPGEFYAVKWFHKDNLPGNTDPHLYRFVKKYYETNIT